MELRDILTMLRNHWVGTGLLIVAGLLMAMFVTVSAVPEYRATNSVLVTVVTGDSITDLNQGASFASRQVKTYAEVARSPRVLDPIIQELGIRSNARALRSDVQATVKGEIQIIDITVTRPYARESAAIADAVAAQLATVVEDLSPARTDGSPSVEINSIAAAVVPAQPFSPNARRNLALGGVVGLVLGFGWAALRTTLDTKVRTESDVSHILGIPVLATIGHDPRAGGKVPDYLAPPLSTRAEEYRQLRTSLQFVDAAHRPRSIVVTSSRGGEGKSVTALNLALALAHSGSRVCLVDADLRRPSVAAYLGIEGAAGLTTVLIGKAELDDVLQPIGDHGLMVLTSGRTPPNPSELLGSTPMYDLVAKLEERFDLVILDCAPLLPVADAAVLSHLTDGVVLVVGCGIVTKDQLAETHQKLGIVGARPLGLVINQARRSKRDSRTYGYPTAVAVVEDPGPAAAARTELPAVPDDESVAAPDDESLAASRPHGAHTAADPITSPDDDPPDASPPSRSEHDAASESATTFDAELDDELDDEGDGASGSAPEAEPAGIGIASEGEPTAAASVRSEVERGT